MWFYYVLLAIEAAQAGQILQAVTRQNNQSNIKISGTGTITNDKTVLNINVQIDGNGGGFPEAGDQVPVRSRALPTQTPTGTGTPPAGSTPGGTIPAGKTGGACVGAPGADFTPFEQEALTIHNKFRSVHSAPLMTLDKAMCQAAAKYAAFIARKRWLQHSNIEGQGENLSMGCNRNNGQTATQAVTNWYNGVCKPGYDFGRPGWRWGTGQFTQVVWKASTKLGIGKFDTRQYGMKCTYIVGRYKPQGNFITNFHKNVLKGSFKESYCNTVSNGPFWDQKIIMTPE